ncbi:MAG: hypothetical protein MJZ81_07455 [Bacteroidales bacterium]|nr:hypothetical protein [Bacteroidales bacterium]
MKQSELKRRVGYVQPEYAETCGTCRNCVRRGTHLRCSRWEFAVVADGICRDGYERHDPPLNAIDTPLFFPLAKIYDNPVNICGGAR